MNGTSSAAVRILFVDDADDFRNPEAELLRLDHGYVVDEACSAVEALALARQPGQSYQVALIDQVLEGPMDGIELMQALRTIHPKLDVILLTGLQPERQPDGLRAGAYRFVQKPPSQGLLHQMIEMCIDMQRAKTDLAFVQREQAFLETLLELSRATGSLLSQAEILLATYQYVGRLMDASSLDVALLDRRRGELEFALTFDNGQREGSTRLPFPAGEEGTGFNAWVIRRKAPLLISNYPDEPPPVPPIHEGRDSRSWLGVPLLVKGHVFGAISVQSPEPNRYDSTDQRILMAIANLVAQALHNARLYSELEVLNEISRRIAAIGDLEELLDVIAREAGALIDTRNLRIGLHRPGSSEVDMLVRYDNGARQPALRLDLSQGLIGHTIRTGRSLLLHSQAERELLIRQGELIPVGDPSKSWLSVPLVTEKGEIVGAVGVQDYGRESAFDAHDQEVITRLASHIAVAVNKAQLSTRLQRSLSQHKALYEFTAHLHPELGREQALFTYLTGVTAGYGLGFNRAMLFRWEPASEASQERGWLSGWLGLGDMGAEAAIRTWEKMKARGIDSFQRFREMPLAEVADTPAGRALKGIRIEVQRSAMDPFSLALFWDKPGIVLGSAWTPNAQAFLDAFQPREFAVVPLRAGAQRLGVLVADNKFNDQAIDREDLAALVSFSDAAMALLENARLHKELERRIDVLNGHYQVMAAIRTGFDPDAVLKQIAEALKDLYNLDTCTVGLLDAMGKVLIFEERHQIGLGTRHVLEVERISHDLWQKLLDAEGPIVFDNPTEMAKIRPLLVHRDLGSFVVLPVKDPQTRLRGVLTMGRFGPLTVRAEDHENLKALAGQAGITLANAELLEQILRRNKADRLLVEIGKRITASVASDADVRQEIVEGARELTGADSVVLYPYLRESRRYDVGNIAHVGLVSGKLPAQYADKERKGWTMSNMVLRLGMLVVDDVETAWDRERKERIRHRPGRFLDREGIKSFVGISLDHGQEQRAVLFVNFRRPHAFSDEELLTIQSYASQAAIVIALDRSMSQVNRLSQASLHAIDGLRQADKLLGLLERPVDEVWRTILTTAAEVSKADRGWFLVVNGETGELVPQATYSTATVSSAWGPRITLGGPGITAWIAEHKRAVRVGDVKQDKTWTPRYVETTPTTQSEMGVPILFGRQRKLLGIIDLESDQKYAFTRDAQRLVEALSAAAAVAFDNASLYRQAARRQRYLKAQLAAAKTISASLDRKATLDRILDAAVHLTEIEGTSPHRGTIRLWDEAAQCLVLTNVYPSRNDLPEAAEFAARIPLPDGVLLPDGRRCIGVCGRVTLQRKTAIVDKVDADPDYLRVSCDTRSEIAVPLLAGKRLIGVLSVQHQRPAAFNREDQRALETLAGQAAVAILNIEAYEQLEARRQELVDKKDELAASTAVAWAGILGSTAAHDIQGYASAIRNSVEEVQRKVHGERVEPRIAAALSDAKEASQEIMEQAGQFRLEPDELTQPLNLHDLLRDRLARWQSQHRREGVCWTLECAAGPSEALVRANPLALAAAFKNLVDNSVKAMRGRPVRQLTLRLRIEDQRVYIDIVDTGSGIPPKVQRRLFREQITRKPGEGQGGLGLLIAGLIVHASGGEIDLKETGRQGTTFTLWLPLIGASA